MQAGGRVFEPRQVHHFYALVTELAYVADSKPAFCGFKSHPGHQIYGDVAQLGECLNGIQKVVGSRPIFSTIGRNGDLLKTRFQIRDFHGVHCQRLGLYKCESSARSRKI